MGFCVTCGHGGDMHSDGENTHCGECMIRNPEGSYCNCKKFIDKEFPECVEGEQ